MSHTLSFLSDTHIYTGRHTAWWSIYDHTPPHLQCIKTHSQSTSDTITLLLFSLFLFTISFSAGSVVQSSESLPHHSIQFDALPETWNKWLGAFLSWMWCKENTVYKAWTSEDNQMHDCKRWTPTYTDIYQRIFHIFTSIVLLHVSCTAVWFPVLHRLVNVVIIPNIGLWLWYQM